MLHLQVSVYLQPTAKVRNVSSLVQVLVSALDNIGTLLTNHVDRVLNATVGNNRNNGRIGNAQVLNTVNAEVRVNNSLVDVLRQTGGTARVWQRGSVSVKRKRD